MRQIRTHPPARLRPHLRRGFSFVEVLFAVMILGVGFIMSAAIFPVGVKQAQTAADETTSAAVAWNAMTIVQEKLASADLPPAMRRGRSTGSGERAIVRSFRDPQVSGSPTLLKGYDTGRSVSDPVTGKMKVITYAQPADYLWNQLKGEQVVADDPRYAWVAMYHREFATSTDPVSWAKVVVIVARAPDGAVFRRADVNGKAQANLQPHPVTFKLTSDGKGPAVDQVVQFTGGEIDAAAEGAFLVLADDTLPAGGAGGTSGAMNCYVFRLGNRIDGTAWELSPEGDFSGPLPAGEIPPGFDAAEGFIVGRAPGTDGYEGLAQDVSAYFMLIPLP